ncbi:Rne/Rng family ribonuclease [Actinocorallia longicatena]|uniref:S1 motif domain-containing protein n=1 Tax=Actinocorallia longicatena TaxID=111803 RepID=A0ABP6QGI0_9ACTN
MLDNDNESTEGLTEEPPTARRKAPARRRAARPAGPPPEPDDAPAVVVTSTTELAPEPAADLTPEAEEALEPEAAAVTTPEPKTPVKRTRVRKTAPKAEPAEPAEAIASDEPAAEVTEAVTAEKAAEAAPKRARAPRRATRKAAEPIEPVEPAAEDEPVLAEAVAEPAAAPRATRSRTRRAAAAPTAEPAETLPEAVEAVAAEIARAAEIVAEGAEAIEAAEEAKTTRTRRRRATRPAAAPEDTEPAAEVAPVEAAPAEDEVEAAEETEAAAEAPRSTRRTRARRATRGAGAPEDVPLVADPFAPTLVTPFVSPAIPTVGFFDESEEEDEDGAVDVVFQPPMVIFQAPSADQAQPVKVTRVETPEPEVTEPEEASDEDSDDADSHDEDGERPSRRRRRRGGRGRGRVRDESGEDGSDEDSSASEAADEQAEEESDEQDDDAPAAGSRRRRRRRRRSSGDDGDEPSPDDPPNTVVRVREPRVLSTRSSFEDEVQSVRGSTRLEAKKQRRREGRDQGRRRPPIITEAEFLARREAVERVMVVRQEGERTQIGVLEDGVLVEHYVDRASHTSYVGNVYLGKVQNVLPSMEAAFVDIGKGRNAVLYAGEVNWDVAGLVGQPRRIESALKSGQAVLVQVTKDPLGHKGARLTSQVSLPGRYLVYVPDGSMTGISRKLPDKERTRLKTILRKIMPENAGVIVRTAAEGASEEELTADVERLSAQWENIQKQVKTANAPSLLHGEPDMTIRVIRDIFNEDFAKLVVSGGEAWAMVQDYVNYVAPHLAERAELWNDTDDAFGYYRIDEQLAKALERKVWLPSGGSLVIDRTEAMTVVDVNTGKFTGQGGNLEETVTRNNLEAAEEIVRQLRLRDLGGIIVIDFIDMVLESNRDLVLRRLLECLARDRTKHQVAEVTSLGLVQMTRKRVGSGLLEAFSEVCDCCNGRGIHVSLTPVEERAPGVEGNGSRSKRKRKGDIERVVDAKVARADSVAKEAAAVIETSEAVVAEIAPAPVEEKAPAKPRTRTRKVRPAGPPPEDDAVEEIGTVALTLDSGETVRVEAVVDTAPAIEDGDDLGDGDAAPKRRRNRRPTRAEKIEASKSAEPAE